MTGDANRTRASEVNVHSPRRRPKGRTGKTPGVQVLQRHGGVWALRWRDPDTGRQRQRDLAPDEARTVECRTRAARALTAALATRKGELQQGAPRKTAAGLVEAFAAYFQGAELRSRTEETYREVSEAFGAWCATLGIRAAGGIDADVLVAFAAHVRARPKRVSVAGGGVGETMATGTPRAAATVSRELRALSAMLNRMRRMRLIALTSGAIADALERPPARNERGRFLTREECQALWAATGASIWTATSASLWTATGTEAGVIGVFVRVMLLTGMRAGEGRGLLWAEVDATDRLIRLPASRVKTARGRDVDLDVSPSVLPLLKTLPKRGPYVFGPDGEQPLGDVRKRIKRLGIPDLKVLRRTASSYLCSMPSYGLYRACERHGHDVVVAQRHYAGAVRIDRDVTTLEGAMGLPLPPTDE